MEFNQQDRQDYRIWLKSEIRKENKKPQTIAKLYNLESLSKDLENVSYDEQPIGFSA